VLNGEIPPPELPSPSWSGASDALAAGSTECDLPPSNFGFPARLIGGGTGGAEAIDLSKVPLLRGSPEGLAGVFAVKKGLVSNTGVPIRLAALNGLIPFRGVPGDGDSMAACGRFREGSGECIGVFEECGGDLGELTRTRGGDLVGDLGGEKATIEIGRGLELLHGVRMTLPRGVMEPLPVLSDKLGVELRPPFSLGMSNDMRPSVLFSSGARRPLGEACEGVAGAGVLFALSMFSKWLRREDTGFCSAVNAHSNRMYTCRLRWTSRRYSSLEGTP
jgi:hypothetical protein